MASPNVEPGPVADHAYRLGLITATIAAVVPLAVLAWRGVLTPLEVGLAVLAGFPVYLLVVASALSVWLGYDKDATDLRPVYHDRE